MPDLEWLHSNPRNQILIDVMTSPPEALVPNPDHWPELQKNATYEGVAGLLYLTLRNKPAIPPIVLENLKNAYRRILMRNISLMEDMRRVLARFAAASIPVIVLKGAVLSELVYGDLGLRPMSDIDLLVKPDHVDQTITLLQEAGFQRASSPELRPGFDLQFRMEVEFWSPVPLRNVIEIHWKLLGPLFACRHVDHRAVWKRAEPVSLHGQPAYILSPADWVLHQAAHAFYKHRHIRLLDLFDLDRLIRHLGNRLDWKAVQQIGADSHWLPSLAATLRDCVAALGTPIPDWILQATEEYRLPRFDRWLLNWWLKEGRPEQHHIFPDWLTLPGGSQRWRVLWAYLFPGRAYMKSRYPNSQDWKLPFLYLQRWRHEMDVD